VRTLEGGHPMPLNWWDQRCKNGIQKTIYMFNAISIKIPVIFLTEILKISPKVHMETQKAKAIWSKTSIDGGITILDCNTPMQNLFYLP
jgi:hypothetical protein